jgi:glutaredoxin 3
VTFDPKTFIVYSKGDQCKYCVMAKQLLAAKNLPYHEEVIGIHILKETFLDIFPDAKTVPVVVLDGQRIGGYTELKKFLETYEPDQELLLG